MTALWLGVSGAVLGTLSDMHPILGRTRKPLPPGLQTFSLRWTVLAGLCGGIIRYLVATWETRQASVTQVIAGLASPRA